MTVLLFAATILTFLGIDYFVRRNKVPARSAMAGAAAAHKASAFRIPEGIYFSKTHTWLTLFPSGSVQVGVDDFASRMFTRPTVTLLKKEGEAVKQGEPIIRMDENGKAISLHSPINGRITRRNARLTSIDAMKGDLFLHGWAYQMEPKEGPSVLRDFFLGAETRTWMKSELSRLRDFMAHSALAEPAMAAASLQDGGEPMPGMLAQLSAEDCQRFEQQFLSND